MGNAQGEVKYCAGCSGYFCWTCEMAYECGGCGSYYCPDCADDYLRGEPNDYRCRRCFKEDTG